MAADAGSPIQGNDAVADRLAKLNRKMDEAQAAAARAKTVGRVMTVLVVVAAFTGVYLLLKPLADAYQNPEPYKKAFQEEFEASILPRLQEEMGKNGQRIALEVKDEVVKKVQARQEEIFGAVDTEMRAFVTNLQDHGTKEFETRQATIRKHIEETLLADVPELKDPEKADTIMANASAAMDGAVQRLMNQHLAQHMEHMLSIERRINEYPVPEDVARMSDDELSQAMVDSLGQYAMLIFRSSLAPSTKDALRQVAEPAPAEPAQAQ